MILNISRKPKTTLAWIFALLIPVLPLLMRWDKSQNEQLAEVQISKTIENIYTWGFLNKAEPYAKSTFLGKNFCPKI